MLIVLYPDNGRWMRENGSEQENLYRKRIMVNAVEESIRTQMKDVQAEFLMCQFALLVVVPVKDETERIIDIALDNGFERAASKAFPLRRQPGAERRGEPASRLSQGDAERGAGRGEGKRPLAGYLPEHADSSEPAHVRTGLHGALQQRVRLL